MTREGEERKGRVKGRTGRRTEVLEERKRGGSEAEMRGEGKERGREVREKGRTGGEGRKEEERQMNLREGVENLVVGGREARGPSPNVREEDVYIRLKMGRGRKNGAEGRRNKITTV